MNDLFLKALRKEPVKRPPVWFMRQAGRYMPEYRALRGKYSFLEMCHNPELIAKVTQLPIQRFGFDAAILFSDILVIPEALQVGLHFDEGKGPIIDRPLSNARDVDNLPAFTSLNYVCEGIKLLKQELTVPLIGFCGAPFTVASYMIEGGSSREFKKTKQWLLNDPESFHRLLTKLADASVEYLNSQIDAGVDAVQIFDSWAWTLGHTQFKEFSLHYLKYILDRIKKVPTILFCRGSSVFAEELASIQPTAVGLDWNADMLKLSAKLPTAVQGNLDPALLYAPKETLKKEILRLVQGMQDRPGYIFNLGHGIYPDTPVENVEYCLDVITKSCVKS